MSKDMSIKLPKTFFFTFRVIQRNNYSKKPNFVLSPRLKISCVRYDNLTTWHKGVKWLNFVTLNWVFLESSIHWHKLLLKSLPTIFMFWWNLVKCRLRFPVKILVHSCEKCLADILSVLNRWRTNSIFMMNANWSTHNGDAVIHSLNRTRHRRT